MGVEDERLALLLAASGHALDFRTWRSPVRQQGLDEEQAVEFMMKMVRCATRNRGPDTTTLPASMTAGGYGTVVPTVGEGATTGIVFETYIETSSSRPTGRHRTELTRENRAGL